MMAVKKTLMEKPSAGKNTVCKKPSMTVKKTVMKKPSAGQNTVCKKPSMAVKKTVMEKPSLRKNTVCRKPDQSIDESSSDESDSNIRLIATRRSSKSTASREEINERRAAAVVEFAEQAEVAARRISRRLFSQQSESSKESLRACQQKGRLNWLIESFNHRSAVRELAEECNAGMRSCTRHQVMYKQASQALKEGRAASVPYNMKYN